MERLIYSCNRCGRALFAGEHIIDRVNLWDLGDYQAEAYLVAEIFDLSLLRRYDVSLHEGWYCCRFIAMRMVVDKFGTGDHLIVYADSVIAHREGERIGASQAHAAVRLGERDFDDVVSAHRGDRLAVVKLGAIWCPPCRLMDAVFDQVHASGAMPSVDFFDVDTDESPKLASRFRNRSIPYTRFYFAGRPIALEGASTVDGGWVGGLRQRDFVRLAGLVHEAARQGASSVRLAAMQRA